MFKKHKTKSGLTLIELLVSMTLFGIMMMVVIELYFEATQTNKKLELIRLLQSNARNITETIGYDVREHGINFEQSSQTAGYNSKEGTSVLVINDVLQKRYQTFELDKTTGQLGVSGDCKRDKTTPKLCVIGYASPTPIAITNSNVHIENLKFYISGGEKTQGGILKPSKQEGRVTIVFDMSIADKAGIASSEARNTSIHVQTTLSEKIYKKDS